MKFIPILFSTEMVQAILANRKKQTRRTRSLNKVNEQPNDWHFEHSMISPTGQELLFYFKNNKEQKHLLITSPFGKRGDVLWVRESYHRTIAEELKGAFYYKASTDHGWDFKWKPSIHMPKQACRIFLIIKDIRVERLQNISENDIQSEGIYDTKHWVLGKENSALSFLKKGLDFVGVPPSKHERLFALWAELWCKINGRESWDSNPWVWVIEFERIEKPKNFI